MSGLSELAARVEALPDITCPLCGDTGFDIPGYIFSHRNGRNCEVEAAVLAKFPNDNAEVAAALRARAPTEGEG